jgi:integrase
MLRSTKQTDKAKALQFALDCQRAERLAGQDNLSEQQAREIISDMMKRVGSEETIRCKSVAEWFNEWLESKEDKKSESTGVRYRKVVEGFLDYIGPAGKKPLTSLTTARISGFLAKRTKEGLSPTTVNLDGKILRTALNRARRLGLVTVNVAEAVELPEMNSVERGTFSPAEVGLLIGAAEGEWKTLILLAYYTGARLGDCVRMVWTGDRFKDKLREGVDLSGGSITYHAQKTGKLIQAPLHPDLQTHLEKLASTDAPEKFIMPGMADRGPGGRNGLSQTFKRLVLKAGVDLQTVQGAGTRKISRRTFHALRHSFTSALANAGVPPELRMKLTGHKSAAVLAGYTHHELQTLKDAVGKLPTLPE